MTNSEYHAYMTAQEFITMAIELEAESAQLYADMQQEVDGSTAQLLQLLERQEIEHKNMLERFDATDVRGVIQFPPELSAAMPDTPEGNVDLVSLIEFAIEREQRAYQAYHAAARSVSGPFRDLVEGLARFELEHEDRLKGLRNL